MCQMQDELLRIRERVCVTVLVTHDALGAVFLANRVVLIKGRSQRSDSYR